MALRRTSIFRRPFGPRIKRSRQLKREGIGYREQLKSGAYIYKGNLRYKNPLKGGQLELDRRK